MGVMDEIRSGMPGAGKNTPFLNGDDRETMVSSHQPFNVVGVRGPRDVTFQGKSRTEWLLDLVFLDVNGNVALVDDGEGGSMHLGRTLTLGATDYRNREFPLLRSVVDAANGRGETGVGPLMLVKQKVQNQPNSAYMLADWDRGTTASNGTPPPPPPPGDVLSPDGRFKLVNGQWQPVEVAPPPPPSQEPIPASNLIPFSGAAKAEGPTSAALPAPGVSQPVPEGTIVRGHDGEGGIVETVQYPGDQIRQAVYREDGVVQQPSGVLTKNANAEPKTAPPPPVTSPDGKFILVEGQWIPLPSAGGIAQEAATEEAGVSDQEGIPVLPTVVPEEEIPENERPPAKPRKAVIPMKKKCDHCGKTVSGSAFQNSKKAWIITHSCEALDPQTQKRIGSTTIDVTQEVNAFLSESR